jgi:hypothetical protein
MLVFTLTIVINGSDLLIPQIIEEMSRELILLTPIQTENQSLSFGPIQRDRDTSNSMAEYEDLVISLLQKNHSMFIQCGADAISVHYDVFHPYDNQSFSPLLPKHYSILAELSVPLFIGMHVLPEDVNSIPDYKSALIDYEG